MLAKTTNLYREFIKMQKSKFSEVANKFSD